MTTPTALPLSVQALLKAAFDQCDAANATAITGLTGSARALFTAVTARREMVSVLVVSTDAEVESLTSDTRFFFASLEGLLPSDAERAVLPFPSLEVDPYCGLAPHFEVASARARLSDWVKPAPSTTCTFSLLVSPTRRASTRCGLAARKPP